MPNKLQMNWVNTSQILGSYMQSVPPSLAKTSIITMEKYLIVTSLSL